VFCEPICTDIAFVSAYVLLAIAIVVVDQICVLAQECSGGTDTIPLIVPQSILLVLESVLNGMWVIGSVIVSWM
jgi:hypothetical protein